MKKFNISTKIIAALVVILTIGLVVVWSVSTVQTTKMNRQIVINGMNIELNARTKVISEYIDKSESYLKGYAQTKQMSDALSNKEDKKLSSDLNQYTKSYGDTNREIENIYVADYNSLVISSYVPETLGKTLRNGDSLNKLHDLVYSSKDVHNVGIMKSPSTGQQVLSMYYPIYDNSQQPLGFAGGAVSANNLRKELNDINTSSDDGKSYMLLDAINNAYVFCDDDEKIGQKIDEENILKLIDNAKNDTTGSNFYEYKDNGSDMISVSKYMKDRGLVLIETSESNVAFASVNKLSKVLAFICITVLLVSIVVGLVLVKLISKDILDIGLIIKELGSLDLSNKDKLKKYCSREDEVGIIAKATSQLIDEIINVVSVLKDKSSTLFKTSKLVSETSETTKSSANGIKGAVSEIAEGAVNQANETQRATENVLHIGEMIQNTLKESNQATGETEKIYSLSNNVLEVINKLIQINDKAKVAVDKISKQTIRTNESVTKIKSVTEVIASIVEETNLLSLNASIEAARAGEAGKGFSVVASQIKTLAEQCSQSAKNIDEIVNNLISDSSEAVITIDEVNNIMEEKNKQLVFTEKKFKEVNLGIDRSSARIKSIDQIIKNVDKEREDVVQVVENLTAIAEENAASTEETLASTEEVNNMMEEISVAAEKLDNITKDIENSISKFKL